METETQILKTNIKNTQSNEQESKNYENKKTVFRSYHLVWFIVGVINVLLAFRFVFELFAANPYSGFAQLVYALSYPFALPFQDIFRITVVSSSLFDWSLLVAILVYLLIGYGLIQLLRIILPSTPGGSIHDVHSI